VTVHRSVRDLVFGVIYASNVRRGSPRMGGGWCRSLCKRTLLGKKYLREERMIHEHIEDPGASHYALEAD
jgi:hypothetical protein